MSKRFRNRLDSWARRAHVNYFGEHLSLDEREALDEANSPSKENPLVTNGDLSSFGVASFNGRNGIVVAEDNDYATTAISNDSNYPGDNLANVLNDIIAKQLYWNPMAYGIENSFSEEVLSDGGTYHPNSGGATISKLFSMDLWRKTKLLLTPAGTKAGTGAGDGKLYSIKGSDFTVARNSKASYVDIDGYIRQVQADEARVDYANGKAVTKTEFQSTNKVLYPFSLGNVYWTKLGLNIEADPSTAGAEEFVSPIILEDEWTDNGDGSYSCDGTQTAISAIKKNANLPTGKIYICQFTIDNISSGKFRVIIGGSNYSAWVNAVGTYTFYLSTNFSGQNGWIHFQADTNFVGTVSNLSVKEVQGFASPFKDMSGNILNVVRKLVEDTDTMTHYVSRMFSFLTSGEEYAVQGIFKGNGRNIQLQTTDGTITNTVVFDLENGVVLSGDGEIEEIVDGYYKCSLIHTMDASQTDLTVRIMLYNGGDSYTGDGVSGVYVSGIQVEKSPVATSFINDPEEVEGGEVTRLDDYPYTQSEQNLSEGTFVFDIDFGDAWESFSGYIPIFSNATYNTSGLRVYLSSTKKIRVNIMTPTSTSIYLGLIERKSNKIAITYNDGNVKVAINGVVYSDVLSSPMVIGDNRVELNYVGGLGIGGYWNNIFKSFSVIDGYLSDGELIDLTK